MRPQNGSELDPSRELGAAAGGSRDDLRHLLQVRLTAQPAAAGLVRERLREWLDALRWPLDARNDIVAAVSEGVENVIDHAYDQQVPGDVEINGDVLPAPNGMRQVVLSVTDYGRWRPPTTEPTIRGRGFTIMRANMASVRTVLSDHGTRLQMRSRPVAR